MCTNENALKKSLLINILKSFKGRKKQHGQRGKAFLFTHQDHNERRIEIKRNR